MMLIVSLVKFEPIILKLEPDPSPKLKAWWGPKPEKSEPVPALL